MNLFMLITRFFFNTARGMYAPQVIRSRVRRLEADLTSSRRLAEERGVDIGRLQRSLDAATLLASDRLEAINRLEDDLATAFRSGGKKAGTKDQACLPEGHHAVDVLHAI